MRAGTIGVAAVLFSTAALAGDITVTEAQNGKVVRLAVGQCIDVKLQADTWELPTDTRAWPYLEMRSASQRTSPTGKAVTLDIVLCAEKPGEGLVKLTYTRPWEKTTPPVKTLAFTVKVER